MPVTKTSASALDAALGGSLRRAQEAAQPSASIVLAVLARALDQNVSLTDARRFLRSRSVPSVRDLCGSAQWRTLAALATSHAAESPLARRRRVARRVAIASASGLPAGEAALVALLGLAILDREESWDSVNITAYLAVRLGVSHTSVAARVKKLEERGVLTVLSRGRGVPSRVRFASPTKDAAAILEVPEVAAFRDALIEGEDTASVRVMRTILLPAIGYGALDEATWSVAMARVLGVHRKVLGEARVNRAMRTLRSLGIDPKSADAFVAGAHRLSEGEADVRYREREAERKLAAQERAASAQAARLMKNHIHDDVLPVLVKAAGAIPAVPQTEEERVSANRWIKRMVAVCEQIAGSAEEEPLRQALRRALSARGWSKAAVDVTVAAILPQRGEDIA